MYDCISIGSSLVDIFISSKDLEAKHKKGQEILTYGDKLDLSDFHIFTGGGASNTSVSLARLGYKVAVISETGQDEFSDLIIRDFEREGVATQLLIREKLERTGGSVLLVTKDGERIAMTYRGAASMLDPYDIPAFWLTQSRWVHLSSIAGQKNTLEKIFKCLIKDQDTKLSWNPGKGEINLLLKNTFNLEEIPCEVFFVNQQEWASLVPVQKSILVNFPQVIVTMGKKGGEVYMYGKKKFVFEGQASQAIDNTGAGDSFAAGYIAALIDNRESDEAIVWGVRNASSVVRFYGAKTGLLRRYQMLELLAAQKK
ncbi:MAG: carbohydrate kinase family protein [Candidatus Pacebacteria bacterium]|jgi:ribokinase|nr:carbohydrate kinase family protein [Candidatus Paceibacterota bacterium]